MYRKYAIKAAESLGEGLEFARIDLYNYNGKILAGEITFAPRRRNYQFKPKYCSVLFGNNFLTYLYNNINC